MSKKRHRVASVGFISLGCPKNTVDSEKMLADLVQAGFLIAADPERADVVLVNTCGFIEPAKLESLEAVRGAVENKQKGRVKKVIVAGCLAQRMADQLLQEVEGIDAIVGLDQRDGIAQIVSESLQGTALQVQVSHHPHALISDDSTRLLIGPPHRAYLRISEGCNHRCTFCTIPSIRGLFRSKPHAQIMEEARGLVQAGVVELNLVAQDTSFYGRDLKTQDGLVTLLKQLETIDELTWIRLLYLYPMGLTDLLLETIAQSEKVVPYMDIPLQHTHDRVLKDMRRPNTHESLYHLVERLRHAIPDLVLRTTFIVGFPGETEAEFQDLLDFVKWARFDALGCFPYFPEVGTSAAAMPNQIPDDIKQQRLEQLMLTQQKIAFARNQARVGSELTCLVEDLDSEGHAQGRFYGQAPEIDSVCLVQDCPAEPGSFLPCRVTGTQDYDLICRPIKP